MAKEILPVNFKDDIMSEAMEGRRRYRMIQNPDGTVSFEDTTEYDQVGSQFGQGQINKTNQAVNESLDKGRVIDNINDIASNSEAGYVMGALAGKELNQNLEVLNSDLAALNDAGAIQGLDAREDGVYITYTPVVGADTVTKKLGSGIGVLNELTLYWYRDSQELSGAWFGGGGESTIALNVSNCNTICITTVSKSSNTGDDPGNAYYYRSSSESQNLISSGSVIDVSNTDTLWIRCVGGGNLPGRGSRRGTITLRDIVYN